MSLIPHINNKQSINIDDLQNINNVYNNKDILLAELHKIEKNKIEKNKNCPYCNKNYDKYQELKNHIIIECFSENMKKKNHIEDGKTIIVEGDMNNTTNSNNINNINITNITVNIAKPIAFGEDWNLSHIDSDKKTLVLFSKIMYTKLLEEILKNEINLNVILDKDGKTALVYDNKDNEKKYINMDIHKIVEKSMEKLNKNLLDILKNSDDTLNYLDICEKEINEKFQKFLEHKETQSIVGKYISNIYEHKKNDAIKLMKDITNNRSVIGY